MIHTCVVNSELKNLISRFHSRMPDFFFFFFTLINVGKSFSQLPVN